MQRTTVVQEERSSSAYFTIIENIADDPADPAARLTPLAYRLLAHYKTQIGMMQTRVYDWTLQRTADHLTAYDVEEKGGKEIITEYRVTVREVRRARKELARKGWLIIDTDGHHVHVTLKDRMPQNVAHFTGRTLSPGEGLGGEPYHPEKGSTRNPTPRRRVRSDLPRQGQDKKGLEESNTIYKKDSLRENAHIDPSKFYAVKLADKKIYVNPLTQGEMYERSADSNGKGWSFVKGYEIINAPQYADWECVYPSRRSVFDAVAQCGGLPPGYDTVALGKQGGFVGSAVKAIMPLLGLANTHENQRNNEAAAYIRAACAAWLEANPGMSAPMKPGAWINVINWYQAQGFAFGNAKAGWDYVDGVWVKP